MVRFDVPRLSRASDNNHTLHNAASLFCLLTTLYPSAKLPYLFLLSHAFHHLTSLQCLSFVQRMDILLVVN